MPADTRTSNASEQPAGAPRADGKLEACGLRKFLGRRWVVDGVTLEVRRGEIVGLLGPNGAGKTVTFGMLVGLLRPSAGEVRLDGENITSLPMHLRARHGIGYLPQERTVFHRLDAEDNVAAILETRGFSAAEAKKRADALLEEFGLSQLANVPAVRLSGGEQRRLEVARSLAGEPRFMLFDEPFTGIDPLTIEVLHRILVDLRRRGCGILLTDHNVRETLTLCDRAYVLLNGRVLAHGAASEIMANQAVRTHFLGESFDFRGTPHQPSSTGIAQ